MYFNRMLFVAVTGTLVFLSACSSDDSSAPSTVKHNKKSKRSSKEEVDLLVLTPPKLTLEEGIRKYAVPAKQNMTAEDESQRLTQAAHHACNLGDNDTAEILLDEAIRLDDQNGEAYYQRGRARCNSVAGKDEAAIEDLKNAIRLGHGGPHAHITLARLYDANNQPLKAIDELGLASKIAPREKDIYKSRAAIYVALGQKDKALKDYELVAQLHPNSTLPHFRKGQIFESMKKFDEARAEYEKVIGIDERSDKGRVPLKPLSYKRLAVLNGARGKHDLAIANLTEALRLDNSDDEPLRLRGLEYAKLKNYNKALDDLNAAVELSPETRENFESRAELYDKLGRAELAENDRMEAKRLHNKPAERPIYDLKDPQSELKEPSI